MCRGGVLGGSGAVNVGELSSLFIGIVELSAARFRTIGTSSSLSESVSLRSESSDERRSAAVSSRRRFAALVSFVGSTGEVGNYELQMIETEIITHLERWAVTLSTLSLSMVLEQLLPHLLPWLLQHRRLLLVALRRSRSWDDHRMF